MPDRRAGGKAEALNARELLARLQQLVDAKPAEDCPIEWAVPAYFLGDVGAVAIVTLRSEA